MNIFFLKWSAAYTKVWSLNFRIHLFKNEP